MKKKIEIKLNYRQVWIVFFVLHNLHLTSQHQWNVHAHRSTTTISFVKYPRPQHIKSQPSTPIDVSLHILPCVPWIPKRGFFSQNPGEGSKYTRSLTPGALWSGLNGFSWKLYLKWGGKRTKMRRVEHFEEFWVQKGL